MATPPSTANGHALVASLTHSHRALRRVRYAHSQLRLLLEAGESQFLGRALDELADAVEELETSETTRILTAAEVAEAAGMRRDTDMLELLDFVPDGVVHALAHLRTTIQGLLAEVSAERALARSLSHALVVKRSSDGRRQA